MPRRHDRTPRLQTFAREMRREQTDAEKKIWHLLRDRRCGGFKFRRQVPVAGYIIDFFCEQASLAVELDGEQHAEPAEVEYDRRRTEVLKERGIRVIRFSDREVLRDPDAVGRTFLRVLTEGW
jgi:very-short-patch-repair endonuclease